MKRPAAFALIAIIAAVFVVLLTPRLAHLMELRARRDALETELAALKRKNQELEKELRLLRDDPVYLERVARRKFNKAKEGEIVYKVVRPEEDIRREG